MNNVEKQKRIKALKAELAKLENDDSWPDYPEKEQTKLCDLWYKKHEIEQKVYSIYIERYDITVKWYIDDIDNNGQIDYNIDDIISDSEFINYIIPYVDLDEVVSDLRIYKNIEKSSEYKTAKKILNEYYVLYDKHQEKYGPNFIAQEDI